MTKENANQRMQNAVRGNELKIHFTLSLENSHCCGMHTSYFLWAECNLTTYFLKIRFLYLLNSKDI